MWQDQIQGIGVEGSPIATWYLSSKTCGGVARGLGRLGKCRQVLGDLELAGEVGPESMRRLEGSRGAKEGLNLPICRIASNEVISGGSEEHVKKPRRRKLRV